jgi:hypothetical protein
MVNSRVHPHQVVPTGQAHQLQPGSIHKHLGEQVVEEKVMQGHLPTALTFLLPLEQVEVFVLISQELYMSMDKGEYLSHRLTGQHVVMEKQIMEQEA